MKSFNATFQKKIDLSFQITGLIVNFVLSNLFINFNWEKLIVSNFFQTEYFFVQRSIFPDQKFGINIKVTEFLKDNVIKSFFFVSANAGNSLTGKEATPVQFYHEKKQQFFSNSKVRIKVIASQQVGRHHLP